MKALILPIGVLGFLLTAPTAEALSYVGSPDSGAYHCTCNRYGTGGMCYDESCYRHVTDYQTRNSYRPHYTNYGGNYTYPYHYYSYPNARRYHTPYNYGNSYRQPYRSTRNRQFNYGYYNSGNYYPRSQDYNRSYTDGYTGGYQYFYHHGW